jgi:Peptidase inhibitor I78 family
MRTEILIVVAALSVVGCSIRETVTAPTSIERPLESGSSNPSPRPPTSTAAPIVPPATETCDASKAAAAVGLPATAEVLERARIAAGASVARFLKPNQATTREYLAFRLNLGLDQKNIVRSVGCG